MTRPSAYSEARERMTRSLLLRSLGRHDWNITRTAHSLGVTRTYVYKLLKRHELKREA